LRSSYLLSLGLF